MLEKTLVRINMQLQEERTKLDFFPRTNKNNKTMSSPLCHQSRLTRMLISSPFEGELNCFRCRHYPRGALQQKL